MEKDLNLIAKGAFLLFIGFLIGKFIAYFYRVIIARFLGPTDFGIMSIGVAISAIITVLAGLGIYRGILHFVSIYESQGKKEKVRGIILGSLKLHLIASLLATIVLLLLSKPLALVYAIPELELVLVLFAIYVPFSILTTNLMVIIQSFKKIKYKVYVRSIIENILKLVLTAALLFAGFALFGAVVALLLAAVISFFLSLYYVQKHVYKIFHSKTKTRYDFKNLFLFSWPLFMVGFFTMVMGTIDTAMLGYLKTAFDTGIYNVAYPTANLLLFAASSFGVLFSPIVTGLYARKKFSAMHTIFKSITRWTFAIVLPILLFILLFPGQILGVMFGWVYAEGYIALSILAFGVFIASFVGLSTAIIESIAKTKYILFNAVLASLVNVGLNLLLIPPLGIQGAALATATSFILWNVLASVEVYIETRMHPYSRAYLKPIAAAGITAAIFFFSLPFLPLPQQSFVFAVNLPLLAAFGAAFLLIYALLFLLLRSLEKEDIELLKMAEAKLGIRIPFLRNFIKRFI